MGATIQDILANKVGTVVCIEPAATVKAAAETMNSHHLGALVVMDGDQLAGIFTERDILTRVVAAGLDPAQTTVRQVMTRPVETCPPATPLLECKRLMSRRRFRHVPVVDAGKLVGMISSGDIMASTLQFQEQMLDYLNEYLYGRR